MTTEGYVPLTSQPYMEMYEFERMDLPYWRAWFGANWEWSVLFAVVYVLFIFSCQRVMRDRRPFDLRKPLAAWNFGMGAFSAFAFTRVTPEILFLLRNHGLHACACRL